MRPAIEPRYLNLKINLNGMSETSETREAPSTILLGVILLCILYVVGNKYYCPDLVTRGNGQCLHPMPVELTLLYTHDVRSTSINSNHANDMVI